MEKGTCCERNIEGWRLPGLLKKTGREERRRNSRDSPREARSDLLSSFPRVKNWNFHRMEITLGRVEKINFTFDYQLRGDKQSVRRK